MSSNAMTNSLEVRLEYVPGLESLGIIQIKQFLPDEERNALFAALCENQQLFHKPSAPGVDISGSLHLSLTNDDMATDSANLIGQACKPIKQAVLQYLPDLFAALDIKPFAIPGFDLTFLNGLNGHCGSPHADDCGGHLKVSLLYYLHKSPKAFKGGALKFYKADASAPDGYNEQAIAHIEHEDNVLLAFPSQVFHGITEVSCESDNFADGRFVAVAFLAPQ